MKNAQFAPQPGLQALADRDGNDRDTRNYVKERYKSASS